MNTKAITEATLALLIIAIITMGFLAVFVYNYSERQTCVQKIELCRTSMTLLNTFRKIPEQGLLREPKIDCPICVLGSSNEIKNEDQQKNLHEIADHLRWCWYKTLGKNNKISDDTIATIYLGKKLCFVCSEFRTNQNINPQQLTNYLQKTKIKTGPGTGKTYANYLDGDLGIEGIFSYRLLPYIIKAFSGGGSYFYKDINAVIAPNSLAIPQKARESSQLFPNNNYQLIRYHWVVPKLSLPLNQIFIVSNKDVPQLPCDVYHYQKE